MAVIKKTPAEIEAMKEAGRLSAAVLREVGARCVAGVSTLELDEFAEDYIRSHGGIPTFKGYAGFPGSLCASINEQIVHGIPSSGVKLKSGDIVSIDIGATVDGWAGDNAWTFPVGSVSPDKKKLLKVTEEAMWAGISAARPGNRLGDIGHAVQAVAKRAGLGVVRDYTGHGIGRDMHEDPLVPNYGTVYDEVLRMKPSTAKGSYVKSITIASAMSPGVKVDPAVQRDYDQPTATEE